LRLMGLDVGDKRIGIALSDPTGSVASGLTVLRRTSIDRDVAFLGDAIREHEVEALVVGFPRRLDGGVGPQARKVKAFSDEVKRRLAIDVILWDERLTTSDAEEVMIAAGISREKRKERIDQVAASLILQSYLSHLDEKRRAQEKRSERGKTRTMPGSESNPSESRSSPPESRN
jgi:putative holliday junction resolvase